MMRFVIPVAALALASCSDNSIPTDKVPSIVINTLETRYPAKAVEWEKIGDNYVAELELNDTTDVEVKIAPEGRIMVEKIDIDSSQIASSITNSILTGYPGYKIDDVEQIIIDGKTYYQLELNGKKLKEIRVVFDDNGTEAKNIKYWD